MRSVEELRFLISSQLAPHNPDMHLCQAQPRVPALSIHQLAKYEQRIYSSFL